MCCGGPAGYAGTVLAHRTRRNAGDGVPYAARWFTFHKTGPASSKHVIPRPKAVGISRHRSADRSIPAGDCHVAWRLLAMTEVVGGWFHRCAAAVRQDMRARCLRIAPDGTPGTVFPTPIVGQCHIVQDQLPTSMSFRGRRPHPRVASLAPSGQFTFWESPGTAVQIAAFPQEIATSPGGSSQ